MPTEDDEMRILGINEIQPAGSSSFVLTALDNDDLAPKLPVSESVVTSDVSHVRQ